MSCTRSRSSPRAAPAGRRAATSPALRPRSGHSAPGPRPPFGLGLDRVDDDVAHVAGRLLDVLREVLAVLAGGLLRALHLGLGRLDGLARRLHDRLLGLLDGLADGLL